MVQVQLYLDTSAELDQFASFIRGIEAARQARYQTEGTSGGQVSAQVALTSEAVVPRVTLTTGVLVDAAANEALSGDNHEKTPLVIVEEQPVKEATADEAVAALRAFLTTKSSADAVKILGEFGVARVLELAADQRQKFIARLTTA